MCCLINLDPVRMKQIIRSKRIGSAQNRSNSCNQDLRAERFGNVLIHTEFKSLSMTDIDKLYGEGQKIMIDVKGLLNRKEYEDAGYCYWRL